MAILEKVKDKLLSFHSKMGMEKRTITRKNNEPYLTRYYLFRKPVNWLPSLYLHCFHASDEDPELHNHPWDNSFSLILSGSYKEEYRRKDGNVVDRVMSPGKFNFVSADKFHRIDLESKEVWTLFLSGRKNQGWGFWNRDTNEFVDWKTHEDRKAAKNAQEKLNDIAASIPGKYIEIEVANGSF